MTQFPALHLNGSPADHLIDPLMNAISLLTDAHEALRECAPHGRDYYVISGTAIDTATFEHRVRLQRIKDTMAELLAIVNNVSRQRDVRDAARQR